jgi:outer membrane protein OmpA-like peptidoglycan-associated protein
MASLLELVQEALTPDITRKIGGLVGEAPAATDSVVRRAAPTVLAGVIDNTSTTADAERMRAMITEGGWGSDVLGTLGTRLTGGSATGTFLSSGARIVSSLFGNKTDRLTELIASGTGVQRGSTSTVLSLITPIVMSVIGKQIASRGLSASGLTTLLAGERSSVLAALPSGMAGLLGIRDAGRVATDATAAPAAAHEPLTREAYDRDPILEREATEPAGSGLARWWPALVVGLAAIAILFLLSRGRQADVATTRTEAPAASPRQMASITLPGGMRVDVDQGGPVHQLSTYLADTSATGVPRRFVFDDLRFETGSTQLTPDGQRTVDSLQQVLKAYPSVRVSLEGHTDTSGDAAANKALSQQRADAVKQTLVSGGIDADRIKTEGHGQERPVADNNTEAGRARNRRLELIVVQR